MWGGRRLGTPWPAGSADRHSAGARPASTLARPRPWLGRAPVGWSSQRSAHLPEGQRRVGSSRSGVDCTPAALQSTKAPWRGPGRAVRAFSLALLRVLVPLGAFLL